MPSSLSFGFLSLGAVMIVLAADLIVVAGATACEAVIVSKLAVLVIAAATACEAVLVIAATAC